MLNIFKQLKLLFIDQFILSVSGGGGGGAPSTTTQYQTQIPEYARGYVENMLGATQNQLFKTDAEGKISGFQDYKPYSTNPSDYIASFSPLQQQAQSGAANLKMPGQYDQASNMTGIAGLGSLQAGQNYARNATDPGTQQAYMSPYIQNALQPQLAEMQRQYGITGAQQQGQATQQGAFGGGREAIMAAENERNKNMAMNKAIGEGYQNAFQQAQQAQQFGSTLGLQGLSQAGQAGAGLASIGGQKLAAEQGILGTQNQMGAQQQQQQQAIINQAIQNYATEQQYPMLQLGSMSNMLRGLPMSQQTVQGYQAQPSPVSQLAGLGAAGIGAAGMYNAATGKAKGGKIKAMAGGGSVSMKLLSNDQLKKVQESPMSSPMDKIRAFEREQLHNYISSNPESKKIFSQQEPTNRVGVASIGTGDMTEMAGGGIVAFATGGEPTVKDKKINKTEQLNEVSETETMMENIIKDSLAKLKSGEGSVTEAYKPLLEEHKADIARQKASIFPEFLTKTGLGMMAGAGNRTGTGLQNLISSAGVSALGASEDVAPRIKEMSEQRKQMQAGLIEAARQDQIRRDALMVPAANFLNSLTQKRIGLVQAQAMKDSAQIGAAATAYAADANKRATLEIAANRLFADTYEKFYKLLQTGELKTNYEANPAKLSEDARRFAEGSMSPNVMKLLNFGNTPPPVVPPVPPGGGTNNGTIPPPPENFKVVKPK
jgi:hypothetical protein